MSNSSFSIPGDEFVLLESIRKRCESSIERPNLTEVVRVGIQNLQNLSSEQIGSELEKIGRLKRGRKHKSLSSISTTVIDSKPIAFQNITDEQWKRLSSLLQSKQRNRDVLDGILFGLLYKGRHLKKKREYANRITLWRTFKKWKTDGTWKRVCKEFMKSLDEQEKLVWSPVLLNSFIED